VTVIGCLFSKPILLADQPAARLMSVGRLWKFHEQLVTEPGVSFQEVVPLAAVLRLEPATHQCGDSALRMLATGPPVRGRRRHAPEYAA
jgi:hypothetical protein